MWHLARTVTGGLVTVSAVAQVDGAVARAADGMSPPADRTRLIHLRLAVLSYTYITRLSGSPIIVTIQRNTQLQPSRKKTVQSTPVSLTLSKQDVKPNHMQN